MSDDRERILRRLRGERRARGFEDALSARAAALERCASPRPTWNDDRLQRFRSRFEAAAGTCEHVADIADVPARVQTYLGDVEPLRLRLAPHPLLRGLKWPESWQVQEGVAGEADWPAAVSVAMAGVAETGTLVLLSGPDTPTSLNFLPDYEVVVLQQNAIVDYLEDVWPLLLRDGLPRAVNLVTGPSRTADVEQTIQLGAHGPRRLHLVLVDS